MHHVSLMQSNMGTGLPVRSPGLPACSCWSKFDLAPITQQPGLQGPTSPMIAVDELTAINMLIVTVEAPPCHLGGLVSIE